MSLEKTMRRDVIRILRPLHGTSVENGVGAGTPDVSFAGGWLELKSLAAWPKRAGTVLKIPHYTPQQRVWIAKHHRAGGLVMILLKVADDWVLLDADFSVMKLGKTATRERILAAALEHWGPELGSSVKDEPGGLLWSLRMRRNGLLA